MYQPRSRCGKRSPSWRGTAGADVVAMRSIVLMESTGRVGRSVGLALRRAGHPLRVLGEGTRPSGPWRFLGGTFVSTSWPIEVQASLLGGVDAAFVGAPNAWVEGSIAAAEEHADRVLRVLGACRALQRVVVLSSIGAHRDDVGIIEMAAALESTVSWLLAPTVFVRPAWYLENWYEPFAVAARTGMLPSVLGPIDRPTPMVSFHDAAEVVERLLVGLGGDSRDVIEIEGPTRVTAQETAALLGVALGRSVRAVEMSDERVDRVVLERLDGPELIHGWSKMLRAFRRGEVDFEEPGAVVRGRTTIADVVRGWTERAA